MSFRGGLLASGLAVLALSAVIFYSIPRVGAKLLPMPAAQQERVSGYSDSIALDETGKIRESGRRAFRADVIQRGRLPQSPLWRGQALVVYDGSMWTPAPREHKAGHQFGQVQGIFDLDVGGSVPRDATVVEIYLEPMRSYTLFTPGIGYTVEFKTPAPPLVARDAFGSLLSSVVNTRNIAYKLVCRAGEVLPGGLVRDSWGRPQLTKPEKVRELCLQLPPANILDRTRLRDYALGVLRQAGAERAGVLGRATVLAQHLESNFKYTLDARKTPGVERVTDFLFTTKEGHCEVFAGALTVLLRTIGIPARVVNGFRGGEYHSWTDTYTVLDRHAHAWVEALCEEGWVTLDPTPAASEDDVERTGLLATIEDARIWFEIRWFKNVVALDMNDQEHFIRGLGPALERFREAVSRAQQERGDLKAIAVLLAVALVVGTTLATVGPRRMRGAWRAAVAAGRDLLRRPTSAEMVSRELEPILEALQALGVGRSPDDTAFDLARVAVARLGERARPFEAVVPIYYAARYGGRELTTDERRAIQEAARSLRG
ncbi:MAG TPA: transglutaminaseTgpA domain-containing protein, partial [Planctomycetota bacterium]|nr:transglutaminaseTgpA domain-containing protein [Planctomycetota bacterium]